MRQRRTRPMQRSACTRLTVDEDPEVLPGSQIWLDGARGVWHDLHLVHQCMLARGVQKLWREWRADCRRCWRQMGVEGSHYQLKVQSPSLLGNMADSYAVLAVLWRIVETSRIPGWRLACSNLLDALLGRLEQPRAPAPGHVEVWHDGVRTTFAVHGGRLSGWREWLRGRSSAIQLFPAGVVRDSRLLADPDRERRSAASGGCALLSGLRETATSTQTQDRCQDMGRGGCTAAGGAGSPGRWAGHLSAARVPASAPWPHQAGSLVSIAQEKGCCGRALAAAQGHRGTTAEVRASRCRHGMGVAGGRTPYWCACHAGGRCAAK